MASPKPQKAPGEIEDVILREIFLISLSSTAQNDPKIAYLALTAAEIFSKGKPLMLCRDLMERVLIERLSGEFPGAEPPFPYLVGCYQRSVKEGKNVMEDPVVRSEIETTVRQARKLVVSYARIYFSNRSMFGQMGLVDTSQLLSLIFSDVQSLLDKLMGDNLDGELSCPPGFINDFFWDVDEDTLEPILRDLYERLRVSVERVSVLGNFQQPLRALVKLVSFPNCAKALVNHSKWILKDSDLLVGNGRDLEMSTILGAFFHVSALPNHEDFKSKPDVGQQCFSESPTCRPADLLSSFITIRIAMNILHDGLAEVFLTLLKNMDTQEEVLEYLAEVIKKNSDRSRIQVDPMSCASSGMLVNLSAVMLKLCEPLLDGSTTKGDKIDPEYLFFNNHLDLRQLATLHVSSEEVASWTNNTSHYKFGNENCASQSQDSASSGSNSGAYGLSSAKPLMGCTRKNKYYFNCECFFMTASVLNLGLMKVLSNFKQLVKELARCEEHLFVYKVMSVHGGSPQLESLIKRLEKETKILSQEKLCNEAQILRDGALLQRALSFYRFVVVWLVALVGGSKMPLPSNCPKEFACFPEHFVEDAMDLLIFTSQITSALDGFVLDDFLNFIIMFMACPSYVKNPHLRAKMVEVLNCWLPHGSGLSATASLFEGHQLSLDYLVQNLLKLYVDIEFTGSQTQFLDKFAIRHNIAELLKYLWKVPSHRNAWRQIAREEKGVYVNFLNFLFNESSYLLDKSLNKILDLKEFEEEMSSSAELKQRISQEREERVRQFHSLENIVRLDIKLVNENVGMLAFTSEHIPTPFLLPEMVVRVASMLNYFLLQLVGPQRKSLTVKDPEKYEFRPKQLLKQVVEIYVNIERGDQKNVFPVSISMDAQSYNEQLFATTADILSEISGDGRFIEEFVQLGAKAKVAASDAMDTEGTLVEIPDEFLDPIQNDPFNRSHLTQDMLIADAELKERMEELITSQDSRKHGRGNRASDTETAVEPPNGATNMVE